MNKLVRVLAAMLLVVSCARAVEPAPAQRPNILWLVCEDASVHWFGCYGNAQARTPHIDAFAREGFRYTHAYACAPVCAPARATWITGVHAVSLGVQPMRSRYAIPQDQIGYYPDYLRKAGYFTANHTKTDYNIGGRPDGACWDSNKPNAWELCKPGQPFFQVLNFGASHESSAHGDVTRTAHSPQDVTLAKYHPDEPGIRQTYAKYFDAVSKMDAEVGKALDNLAKAGLADRTIVVFNSDHGGVLPRSKRFLYDSGVHAPLIVRIPERYKHLWPAATPGSTVDRLVSFIDMPKTWLSLAGADIPAHMQGRTFLGEKTEAEPECIFSYRDRMDERFDLQRAVRNKRFVYIKNFMPYVPQGQHLHYLWLMQATRSWEEAWKQGRTDALTGQFFRPKPVEELYDTLADADNVVNLAGKPEHQITLATMRARLRDWQLAVCDSGLLPEAERERRSAEYKTTVFQMVRDPKRYHLPAYLDAADLAIACDPSNTGQLLTHLKSPDSGLRYWGIVGLFMLGKLEGEVLSAVERASQDPCGEVQVMAGWMLLQGGHTAKGQALLKELLRQHAPATLLALNVLDWSKADLTPFTTSLNSLPTTGSNMVGYEQRMVEYLREVSRGAPEKPETPRRPNVVVMLADDLGVNDLGCYGRKEHETPHLDRLAREGVRFSTAYAACPVCSPTRAALLTGKHPARLHLTTFLPGRADAVSQKLLHPKIRQQLPLEETTLAEYLQSAGYATACIGKWHLGGANFGPEKQGFDFVYAGKANTTPDAEEGGKGEYDQARKAEEFLMANRNRPFFLYLCFHTPHIPLGAKTELNARYRSAFNPTYAAMMHSMDDCVGRVLAKLEALSLVDNTLVIFTSDNGGLHVPELKDDPPTHNTPFRAGKGFLYEGGIRVPLLVRWPGVVPLGKIIDAPVISTDWTPTILEFCGLKPTGDLDGASLARLLKGGELSPRPLFWHVPHYMNQGSRPAGAIREGNWKLIEHFEDGRLELFDLATDPGETVDQAATHGARANAMRVKLAAWRKAVGAQDNTPNLQVDAALHKLLYVDTDVSTLKASATAAATGEALKEWRRAMDAAVRGKR
jgi:arylsulfatase A-like enzyme